MTNTALKITLGRINLQFEVDASRIVMSGVREITVLRRKSSST